jgi:hypothetical protein
MRIAALTLIGAFGLAVSAVSAGAAPAAPTLGIQGAANIVQVAGGCGRGMHPNRWGRCVPHGYGYAGPRAYYGGSGPYYGPRPYYSGRHWNSPGDHAANRLNRHELGRIYSGSSMPYR